LTADSASTASPASLGFRWPAEWEPHAATWISWPHNRETWPGRLEAVELAFVAMVRALCETETVCISVCDAAGEEAARRRLGAGGVDPDRDARFFHIPSDDAWVRDCGPVFVVREGSGGGEGPGAAAAAQRLAVLDFGFNAWGGKYPPWDRDDALPRRVAEALDLPRFEAGLVLEAGSIDGNGCGTLLTTESCLLNANRQSGGAPRSRAWLEERLAELLSVRQVLWLGEGIAGDDTGGHVDDLARFVAPSRVVTVVETRAADLNYRPLKENLRRLRQMRDQDGRRLEVISLPMPPPVGVDGLRCPASYANFYLANGVALVPTFGVPEDGRAISILSECLPERRVVGIPCRDLVVGLGAVHCLTQQQPG